MDEVKTGEIEEMANDIRNLIRSTAISRALASLLYDKGYRKANAERKDDETR